MKRAVLIMISMLFATATLFGQETSVEKVLYFRFDRAEIDENYLTNRATLASIEELLAKRAASIDSIELNAYSSPEGKESYNLNLSERRAQSTTDYFAANFPEIASKIRTVAKGEDFDGVVRMIEADANVPHKAQVMKLLRKANGRNNDRQFWAISCIDNGEAYRYIRQNILPYLRTAMSVVFYLNKPAEEPLALRDERSFPLCSVGEGLKVNENDYYTYNIIVEDVYQIDSLTGNRELTVGVAYYTLTISNKGKETVGEYKLVAPNGITNLNGWYSLTSSPSLAAQAAFGYYTADGEACATKIVTADGREAVLRSGQIKITHSSEDDVIDVEGAGLSMVYADGRVELGDIAQIGCVGNGLNPLTYDVTVNDIDSLAGLSRYDLTVKSFKSGVVGEYSLVAPNGITNLTGWYSLTATPDSHSQAIAGVFVDSLTTESTVIVDGERLALRSGLIRINHRDEDNMIDVECTKVVALDEEGSEFTDDVVMLRASGDGVPAVERFVTVSRTHGFALKTNLLYDAATAVNVEAEIPIGNRLSVNAAWTFPWWLPSNWSWCAQMLWGEVEGRVWLGDRSRRGFMQGHFIGAYVGSGLYDFQPDDVRGWQGEFIEGGLGYGYVFKTKSGLNLEFELGIGFMQTDYRSYQHTQDSNGKEVLLIYRQSDPNRPLQYFGPTKAKVSLVWPITWQSSRNVKQRVQNEK